MKIKNNNVRICPICGKEGSLTYDAIQFDGDMCYFPWKCVECETKGEEWYKLTFVGHNVIDEEGNIIEIMEK